MYTSKLHNKLIKTLNSIINFAFKGRAQNKMYINNYGITNRRETSKYFLFDIKSFILLLYQDKISTRPAGTDFTLRLHVETKFRPGKARQSSIWHLFRFACIFFKFFFVSMSVYEIENP